MSTPSVIIPQIQNYGNSSINDDFEIYLGGYNDTGALLLSKDYYESKFNQSYLFKFTKQNIPIPLQDNETIQFVDIGLQFTILLTNLNKCYLFGDFYFGDKNPHFNFFQLKIKINENQIVDTFPNKITFLQCGEQFVIVKDESNTFYYCGIPRFGIGDTRNQSVLYHFIQLNKGHLQTLQNGKDKITHIATGGRYFVCIVNNRTLYGIGANSEDQLGIPSESDYFRENEVDLSLQTTSMEQTEETLKKFYFLKSLWNEDNYYKVDKLTCSGNNTLILTTNNTLLSTSIEQNKKQHSFQIIPVATTLGKIINMAGLWYSTFFLFEDGSIHSLSSYFPSSSRSNNLFFKKLIIPINNFTVRNISKGIDDVAFVYNNDTAGYFTSKNGLQWSLNVCDKEINNCKVASKHFCIFFKTNEKQKSKKKMQEKLFKTNGFYDIVIL
ncbi:hypothetical protein ABK040_008016 [Willaertia magna]